MIDQLIDTHLMSDDTFVVYLLGKTASGFHQTWTARREVLKKGFGIALGHAPSAQRMETVIDVRNAMAHGDGKKIIHQSVVGREQRSIGVHPA